MKPLKDITGKKYNKLTAIKYVGNETWLFQCDCGNKTIKKSSDVKREQIKSCSRKCTTGDSSKHPLYQTWDGIKRRCYQKNSIYYNNYGGRNIKMCDEWKNSFWNFVQDMGLKPFKNSSIERLDNNKDYCKENCVWSSLKEQANNRRNNLVVYYNNNKYTVYNICKLLNIKHNHIYYKIKKLNITPQEYFNKYIF